MKKALLNEPVKRRKRRGTTLNPTSEITQELKKLQFDIVKILDRNVLAIYGNGHWVVMLSDFKGMALYKYISNCFDTGKMNRYHPNGVLKMDSLPTSVAFSVDEFLNLYK